MHKVEVYPKDIQEFFLQFKDEEDCWGYLYEIQWLDDFICPKCANTKFWLAGKKIFYYSSCGTQTSIMGGILFHGTREALLLRFHIMYWLVAEKTAASASNLADFTGFYSYETTWSWVHKLRRVMARLDWDRLSGLVEVDEIYIGGRKIGHVEQGRGAETKTLIIATVHWQTNWQSSA